MAEQEIKIKVVSEGTDQATESLDGFSESLDNTAESADRAKDSSKSMFDTFLDAGANIQGWIQNFQQIGQAVSAASQEYSRQTGIINNLQGSINEASTRMQGMASNISLMESRNRIAATGLQLTEHEFANLSVAAQRYAQTSGQEVNQVMDQLTQAISQGSAEQLQHFGLQLENTTSKAHTQESALHSLDIQYGTLTADVSQASSGITQMATALENAKTEFIEGTQTGGNYTNTINELDTAAKNLANSFGIDVSNGFSLAQASGEIFSMGLNSMVRAMARLMEAVNEFGNMNFANALEAIQSIGNITNEIAAESMVQRATATLNQFQRNLHTEVGAANTQGSSTQAPAAASGGGSGSNNRGLMTAAQGQIAGREADQRALEATFAEQAAADQAHIAQQAFIQQNLQREIDLNNQLLEQAATDLQAKKDALDVAEQTINTRQKEREEAQAALQLQADQAQTQNRYTQGIQGVNTLLSQGANIAATAHKDGKKAAREQLKEWLKSFAISEALKGGTALAEGIGMTVTNPPGAGTKYAEAGYHFALAGSAGGASGLIASGKSGGAGAAGGNGKPETKPSMGSSAGSANGEQGPQSIIINVNGQSLATQAQIGEAVQGALNAYTVRY